MPEMLLIIVMATYDPDAKVWFVESSDLAGLNVEAASIEELRDKVPDAIADLLEDENLEGMREIPIEIVAHAHTRVRLGAGR